MSFKKYNSQPTFSDLELKQSFGYSRRNVCITWNFNLTAQLSHKLKCV
ncbi:MAG: hypothetical protein GXY10_05340 [Clostridiales bacterium]|nr:hypothetical protein [Clostridiales bacterium]